MTFTPGMKVAHRLPHRPDLLALGKVEPDGQHIRWHEIVDSHGTETNRLGQGVSNARPVPIKGDEQPCPPEFEHLIK